MLDISEIIARWDSGEGKPYKGTLIDWAAYEANPDSISCYCAQGQVLALAANWTPADLRNADQANVDAEVSKLLNISRAHAVLLRNINDKADGAPSVVLTDPGKVLGDKWSKLLDFWWMFHCYSDADWKAVSAAWDAAGAAAWAAAWDAARTAAGDAAGDAAGAAAGAAAWAAARTAARTAAGAAAWDAAWAAAGDAARTAAGDAAGDAAWDAAGAAAWDAAGDAAGAAAGEIQGFTLLGERGQDVLFLPMFGIKTLDDVPARPADYGNGLVPGASS